MAKKNKKNKKTGADRKAKPVPDANESRTAAEEPVPELSEIKIPEGFCLLSMTQALSEYALPLRTFSGGEDNIQNLRKSSDIARNLWNYGIHEDKGKKDEIIRMIKILSGMKNSEAADFFDKMIRRKIYLFPPELQGNHPTVIVMRKEEVRRIIPVFDSVEVNFPQVPLPPDDKDRAMIASLERMDRYILEKADSGQWEAHYFSLKEDCRQRFGKWLADKGLSRYSEDFPFCLETFFNFVYRQDHGTAMILKNIPGEYIEKFFMDYLLRKIVAEPDEYGQWLPAIKTFYTFIFEKGYIEDPGPVIKILESIEPHWLKLLKKRFG